MKISPATINQLDTIKKLTETCALNMIAQDILQWNEHYPSRERLEKDIESEELYVLTITNKIIGIVVLSEVMDEEYKDVKWLTSGENHLYIHRLAVDPKFSGLGYGQRLMDFAEDYARKHKYQSVRLDTFSKNKRNQKFYEKRGYLQLEDIYFPKQSEHPFHCYELLL